MAFETPGFKFTREAHVDLSAKQYHFIGAIQSTGRVTFPGTQGLPVLGVLQNKPSALGQAAEIMHSGISKVVAHAAVAANANVATSNTGRAVTATTGNVVVGIALEAANNAGEIISVLLVGSSFTSA